MDEQNIYTIERETELWRGADGTEQLSVTIEYPLFTAAVKGAKKINTYYAVRNKRFIELCKKRILPKAAVGGTGESVVIRVKSRVTYSDGELLSVLTDVTYNDYAEPTRRADLWERRSGAPALTDALFPPGTNVVKLIKSQVRQQIMRQLEYGRFYPNAEKRFTRYLSPDNVYIESSGRPVVFFPQNTIAPRGEGFPQFHIAAPDTGNGF